MDYYKDEEGEWLDYDQTSTYIGGFPTSSLTLKRYRDRLKWVWKKVPASMMSRGRPGKPGAVIGISRKSLDEYLQSMGRSGKMNTEGLGIKKKYKIHFHQMTLTREANSVEEFYGKSFEVRISEDLVESIEDIQTGAFYKVSKSRK